MDGGNEYSAQMPADNVPSIAQKAMFGGNIVKVSVVGENPDGSLLVSIPGVGKDQDLSSPSMKNRQLTQREHRPQQRNEERSFQPRGQLQWQGPPPQQQWQGRQQQMQRPPQQQWQGRPQQQWQGSPPQQWQGPPPQQWQGSPQQQGQGAPNWQRQPSNGPPGPYPPRNQQQSRPRYNNKKPLGDLTPNGPILNNLRIGGRLEGIVTRSTPNFVFLDVNVYRHASNGTYAKVIAELHRKDIPQHMIPKWDPNLHKFPPNLMEKGGSATVYVKEVYKNNG